MLEELKRFNTIGDKSGIFYLAKLIFCEGVSNEKLLKNKSLLNPDIRLNPALSLKFLIFLQIIEPVKDGFKLTKKGEYLQVDFDVSFTNKIALLVIKSLIEQNILDINEIKIETRGSVLYYEISSFPLSAALFRNFLFEIGLLQNIKGVYYLQLPKEQEASLFNLIRRKRRLISQEELLGNLEKQRAQGLLAEKWVLDYEKKRLAIPELKEKIRIISDIDVQAGFDIISFNDLNSLHYDRFIEVKSFIGSIHFYWSKNESEIALIKGENYYLYLIDILQLGHVDYEPLIIQNPIKLLHEDPNWIVETQNYFISKINSNFQKQ
jgi:hypothetical protein